MDAYKFNLLLNKSIFINQIKSNQLGSRKIDEGGIDEANGMNYAEYCAILSGNTTLLDLAKLERELAKVESEKFMFVKDQRQAEDKISGLEVSLGANERRKVSLMNDYTLLQENKFDLTTEKVDAAKYQLNPKTLEDYLSKNLAIIFDIKDFAVKTEKEIGHYLVQLKKEIEGAGIIEIGDYCGFKLYFETLKLKDYNDRISLESSLFVQGIGKEKYTFNGGL